MSVIRNLICLKLDWSIDASVIFVWNMFVMKNVSVMKLLSFQEVST